MLTFSERLAIARKKKGVSQTQLADSVGVKSGKQTISKWELGLAEPMLTQLKKIAEVLDVSVAWLVDGKESEGVMQYTPPPDKVLIDANEAADLYRIKAKMLEQELRNKS